MGDGDRQDRRNCIQRLRTALDDIRSDSTDPCAKEHAHEALTGEDRIPHPDDDPGWSPMSATRRKLARAVEALRGLLGIVPPCDGETGGAHIHGCHDCLIREALADIEGDRDA